MSLPCADLHNKISHGNQISLQDREGQAVACCGQLSLAQPPCDPGSTSHWPLKNPSVKTPPASMASRGPTGKEENALSLMGNPGSPAPLRRTESHGRSCRVPSVCQAPPRALSHTLSYCSFSRPTEEGSIVVRESRRKVSHGWVSEGTKVTQA